MIIKDGNKAVSDVAYYFSDLVAIYPITPSSPMASNVDDLAYKNKLNIFNDKVKVVEMQSEAGVAGAMHGALTSGILATTFTSSQGLLLMLPNMYKIAGEMLPGVIHVASRSLATHALSIFGDHQDIYAASKTGFCLLSSSSVEDSQYMAAIAHLASVEGSLPFLHFMDGFRTSHEINTIEEIDLKKVGKLLNQEKLAEFRRNSLNVDNNIIKGTAQNEDIYFPTLEARNKDYDKMVDIIDDYMQKINKLFHKDYQPFNYYGSKTAQNIIIAMGSVCDTIRLVIDEQNQRGKNYGMVEVHLYRPFSPKYLQKVLPKTIKNIAVLDRTREFGAVHEPLCLDVISALKGEGINIVGGRYGLSSRDTPPAQIKSVFDMLETNLKDNFTIGIEDDVNYLSLPTSDYKIDLKAKEIVIYGYGSDGMVSASKDILKLIKTSQNKFVQGYFEYDSKKSGGVTKSSLRISDNPLKAPYYIDHPDCVVICKEEYLNSFNMIDNIKNQGIVILNTEHIEDIEKILPNSFKKIIKEKNVTLVTLNASLIASENELNGKISKIMETVILEILGVKDNIKLLTESIENKFKTKGADIIANNIKAINSTLANVKIINTNFNYEDVEEEFNNDLFSLISRKEGYKAKVSDLLPYKSGTFPCNFEKETNNKISSFIPKWLSQNCTQCNMCSFVCPHGVVRPFITDNKGIELLGSKDKKKFLIAINGEKCTGCGLCIEACPGKNGNKALEFTKYTKTPEEIKELFRKNKNENIFNKYTIKGSQFLKPRFAYSGACAGCGETSYIKLLTQLLQDDLIIANATGCSSIYGGSIPIIPYTLPWANSLFEDNAEFGYGMYQAYKVMQNRIAKIIEKNINNVESDIQKEFIKWLDNPNDYKITREVKKNLKDKDIPKELSSLIDYIPSRSVWCIGGDGWAYDIGFGGIDHVLSSKKNVNILVLDTEVYSNTGGQSSKASQIAQVTEFNEDGKTTSKKDLFKIAMCYPDTYVASVSLGANGMQCIKAFKEAIEHEGPSIIIAYSPCIEQGIFKGMKCSLEEQKKLVDCGYLLLMRYDGKNLSIDSKEPDFSKYEEVLLNEVRYSSLKIKDEKQYQKLMALNKEQAFARYNYYKNIK